MKFFSLAGRLMLLAVVLTAMGFALWLWNRSKELTEPVLQPINQSYVGYSHVPNKALGLKLETFQFKGWDGGAMQAVIAEKEGEESSRQLTVIGDLTVNRADDLGRIDYVLICVDWDHGIRSALPLAESFTAAGLKCVLWDPRGVNDRRPYCTHGLKESADVPKLIDELERRSGEENPVIVAVGQGFGAGLMLQAAAAEPRIRGIISIDACASLRESIQRTLSGGALSPLTIWLMDMRMNSCVGIECFDVAPVESASRISRNVPVLVVNLVQDNPVSTIKDALTIYRQLPSDLREVWTMAGETDSMDATHRSMTIGRSLDGTPRLVDVGLLRDEDTAAVSMLHWLNDQFVPTLDAPLTVAPPRPELTPDSHL